MFLSKLILSNQPEHSNQPPRSLEVCWGDLPHHRGQETPIIKHPLFTEYSLKVGGASLALHIHDNIGTYCVQG